MQPGVRPARPHTGTTEDGRRLAVLTTYTRRGSRFTEKQAEAWARRSGEWWIPDEEVDDPEFDVTKYFGRKAPLIVEIGCGIGEATAALAKTRPDFNILAFEVWQPGVAETFLNLEKAGVENVRLISVDAVWSLEHLFGDGSIAELWTFFPDPWPKKKHHRRRLVNPAIAELVATRLVAGGAWRIATDWPDYAEHITEVLAGTSGLEGGIVERWQERPLTKFERRGIRAERRIVDFTARRV